MRYRLVRADIESEIDSDLDSGPTTFCCVYHVSLPTGIHTVSVNFFFVVCLGVVYCMVWALGLPFFKKLSSELFQK